MDRGHKRTHDEAEEEEEEVDDVLEDDLFDDEEEEEEGRNLKRSGSSGGGELFSPASKERAKILLKSPWRDRIFVVPDPVPDSAELLTFPHARAGRVRYLCSSTSVMEIQRFKPELGSWFFGENVIEDGTVYICSVVDPLFVILPLLEKGAKQAANRSCSWSQILAEDITFRESYSSITGIVEPTLSYICDITEIDGEPEKYYKLNDTKVLDWLKRKIDSFAGYLLTADPSIARSSAVASSLVRREEKVTEAEALKSAVGFVADYLSPTWSKKIYDFYGLTPPNPLESTLIPFHDKKEKNMPLPEAPEKESTAKPKQSLAQRKLAQVDKKGMASITSFFKKS